MNSPWCRCMLEKWEWCWSQTFEFEVTTNKLTIDSLNLGHTCSSPSSSSNPLLNPVHGSFAPGTLRSGVGSQQQPYKNLSAGATQSKKISNLVYHVPILCKYFFDLLPVDTALRGPNGNRVTLPPPNGSLTIKELTLETNTQTIYSVRQAHLTTTANTTNAQFFAKTTVQ